MKYFIVLLFICFTTYADSDKLEDYKHNRKDLISSKIENKNNMIKKNRLRLLSGSGKSNNGTIVPIFGLGYSRMVTDDLSVGAEALTNSTLLLDFGVNF